MATQLQSCNGPSKDESEEEKDSILMFSSRCYGRGQAVWRVDPKEVAQIEEEENDQPEPVDPAGALEDTEKDPDGNADLQGLEPVIDSMVTSFGVLDLS